MLIILNILNYFGIVIENENNHPFAAYSFIILFISLLLLLCFFNILLYFSLIILLDNKLFNEWLKDWPILKRIANIYKNTRIIFIVFEVLFFIWMISILIWSSYTILSSFT